MTYIKIILSVLLPILFLTSCRNEPVTYTYLMQHPAVLKQKIEMCQSTGNAGENDCSLVYSAAKDFSDILNEQQQDPEKFGQKVMEKESSCSHQTNNSSSKECEDAKILLAVIGINSPE